MWRCEKIRDVTVIQTVIQETTIKNNKKSMKWYKVEPMKSSEWETQPFHYTYGSTII